MIKRISSYLRNRYAEIYKIFLFISSIFLIILLFPLEGKFKYEYQKGKPWLHDDLIATFDFAIKKTPEQLKVEKYNLLKNFKPYFAFNTEVGINKKNEFNIAFDTQWDLKFPKLNKAKKTLNFAFAQSLIDSVFSQGIIQIPEEFEKEKADFSFILMKNGYGEEKELKHFFNYQTADDYIRNILKKHPEVEQSFLLPLLENVLTANVIYDETLNENAKQLLLSNISLTRGMIQNGERIISRGELLTNEKFNIIESLRQEHELQLGASSKYLYIILGQIILVSISICVLVLFLATFRKDIFADNKKILFLLLLIFLMVLITSVTIKYNVNYLYLIPLCIVPIMVRTFSDTRLALFVHIVTIILIGFLVPNSFEFVFLQFIAGIISIISIAHLRSRAQLFTNSLFIFCTYSLTYLGMLLAQEGEVEKINTINFLYFAGSALLTMLSYPLIFIFEKTFGFVTDVSLMELSDTNNPLLRELATKAPGTFQHSLQVANLAEAAIYQIGGNTLLTRTGALYHDVGKIDMAFYFIENQRGGINPHDELSYEDSAKIIISHTTKGIEKARKFKVPDLVIDFIRTHHGTSTTKYFYKLFLQNNPFEEVDMRSFSYRGPIPYSKETAVVMMADAVEAASRSLKSFDDQSIHILVETVINGQIEQKQFINSNITFKDITDIKKVFKRKLVNIYHARIEYPNL